MKKLVIIPAYNEQNNIVSVINDIKENAASYDYIVINDCSNDKTLEVCRDNDVPVIDLSVNLGIGGAVQTGYLYGVQKGYDIAVQFDGDGQHRAEYLDEMERMLIRESADMVIGSRFITRKGFQSSKMRRMGIDFFRMLIRILTGKRITDATSGMRMVNKKVMKEFSTNYPKDYPEPESVVSLIKQGGKVVELPVEMNGRKSGKSSISPLRAVYYIFKVSIAVIIASLGRRKTNVY